MPDTPLEDHDKLQKHDQVLRNDESASQDGPLTPDEQAAEELLNKPLVDEVSEDVAVEVGEFFEQSAEQNEATVEDSDKPYISFDHVYKSFGDFKVLEDVSFFVKPGETLCILGRSGVGKSVSLQMLMGFLKPDRGSISVANENICGFTEKEMQPIRRKVTMVFQNGALFDSVSVGENVAFPLREKGELDEEQIRQVVKGLLEMVGVAGMDDLLPSDLSTGMKRSVAIARALAAQPEAVLYDEPTTMVDPLMAHLLGDLIERLKRQLHLTSIVVTHDMRFAQKLADRLLFLHEGTARFFGTMDELAKSDDPILRDFMALDELVLPK
jgi:phospholipid/cholesterol/gamma-HCH transport system ATP-binding protein